jgi:MFS family permease
LSGAFGGLLASAIIKLDGHGNLAGWRWIFILEGIASSLVGVLSMFFLPESLKKARFLTQEEREFAGMQYYCVANVARAIMLSFQRIASRETILLVNEHSYLPTPKRERVPQHWKRKMAKLVSNTQKTLPCQREV